MRDRCESWWFARPVPATTRAEPHTLAANVASIRRQLERFFDFADGATGALMADNTERLREIGYLAVLSCTTLASC
jgi:hypothetical protein